MMPIENSSSRQNPGDSMSEAIQSGRNLAFRISRLRDVLLGERPEGDSSVPEPICDGALGNQQREAFFTIDRVRLAHNALDEIEGSLGLAGSTLKLSAMEQVSETCAAPTSYSSRRQLGGGHVGGARIG